MTESNIIRDKKGLLNIGIFISLYVLMILVTGLLINSDALKVHVEDFLSNYGLIGVFITVLLLDAVTQPLSPDVVIISAACLTDIDLANLIAIAAIASAAAGLICYTIGQKFGVHFLKKRFNSKSLAKAESLMGRFGTWGVLIGAITPIPYDLVCYFSGIFKLKFLSFTLTAFIGRIARFALLALLTSSLI